MSCGEGSETIAQGVSRHEVDLDEYVWLNDAVIQKKNAQAYNIGLPFFISINGFSFSRPIHRFSQT
jgi:hypothetical protein